MKIQGAGPAGGTQQGEPDTDAGVQEDAQNAASPDGEASAGDTPIEEGKDADFTDAER